jgi:hypothetical protein
VIIIRTIRAQKTGHWCDFFWEISTRAVGNLLAFDGAVDVSEGASWAESWRRGEHPQLSHTVPVPPPFLGRVWTAARRPNALTSNCQVSQYQVIPTLRICVSDRSV